MPDQKQIYLPTVSAMLPTAGLFLPETLHRRDGHVPDNTDPDTTSLKYFQRKTPRSKTEAQEAEKSMVSIASLGSAEDLSGFPSIATAFQFADYVSSTSKRSSESQSLAILLHRVRQDVTGAARLYLSAAVLNFLDAWPDRKSWIDNILVDIRSALNEIGCYIETFRVAGEDGGAIGLKRRFEWISGHQKRLSTKQQLLTTCHQSLVTAINIMQTVELCGVTSGPWQDPIYEAPVQPWVKQDDTVSLRGPYARREWRLSQKNLSLSNINLSQAEQDTVETRSVNSIPAELPGSTPDELERSYNKVQSTSFRPRNSQRRSSHRRTYFERNIDDASSRTTSNTASQEQATFSPATQKLHLSPQEDQISTRNSFDQFPTIKPTTADISRASMDHARPYSPPGQSHETATPGGRPPTSSDFIRPMPTLTEKTVERNDSTTSTTAVISVPHVARRLRANHVDIRRHPDKHRSLPSQLPYLQSQTLLTDDLADWIVPASAQSERVKSTEWNSPAGLSSPSASIVPSSEATQEPTETIKETTSIEDNNPATPAINLSSPIATDVQNATDVRLSNTDKGTPDTAAPTPTISIHDNYELVEKPSNEQQTPVTIETGQPLPELSTAFDRHYAASIRSHASRIVRKPLPATARIYQSIGDMRSAQANACSPTQITPVTFAQSSDAGRDIAKNSVTTDIEGTTVSTSTDEPAAADANMSQHDGVQSGKETAHINAGQKQPAQESTVSLVSSSEGTYPGCQYMANHETPSFVLIDPAESTTTLDHIAIPETSSIAPTPTESPRPENSDAPITIKPMSVQAKRRAAHQRRMELAFGGS